MMLADSFLKGQTYLEAKPKPELLALENPYDPNFNDHYRMHDASLYKEKYYLYFSPVVSLLVIAPFRFISGYYLSETILTTIFACVGFLFSCLVLNRIFRVAKVKPSTCYLFFSYLALAMLTNMPFLIRRSAIYELCIVSAYAFLMVGFYFYLRALEKGKRGSVVLLMAGFLFALCIASRPNQIIIVAMLLFAFGLMRRWFYKDSGDGIFVSLGLLILPIAFVIVAMGCYNYVRFDSFLEFGWKYQLSGIDTKNVPPLSIQRLGIGLYAYLFHSYQMDLVFPFIHITEPLKPESAIAKIWFTERLLGIFAYPFFWVALASIFASKRVLDAYPLATNIVFWMILCSMACLLPLAVMQGVTMIASLVAFELSRQFIFNSEGIGKMAGAYFFYSSIVFSSLISLFSSFSGTYDVLKIVNPTLFNQLRSFFVN